MDTRAKKIITVTAATCLALASACTSKTGTELGGRPENDASVVNPAHSYELKSSHEVNGRQGVCVENGSYWVSGSKTLAKYDSNWDLISVNDDPFKGYDFEVNHIGDIDVYNNELYIGAEYFMDGVGTNIQIAVYDGNT